MAVFSRDEVEAACRGYRQTGAVGEDRDAWSDLCTEDAVHPEHPQRRSRRDWPAEPPRASFGYRA